MPFEHFGTDVHKDLSNWTGDYRPGTYHELPPGYWTDDTEMAVALTESLLACGEYKPTDAAQRYLAWSRGTPHGMGSTTRKAMEALAAGVSWQESGVELEDPWSVGSGTAMRAAPLGVVVSGGNALHRVLTSAKQDAQITHRSPEAWAASFLVAGTVAALHLGSESVRIAVEAALHEASGWVLNRTLVVSMVRVALTLGPNADEAAARLGRGGCAASLVSSAIWCAVQAPDFAVGVQQAVRLGGDTDTRGAITGAILGTAWGLEAIPARYREGLHESERLQRLDAQLVELQQSISGRETKRHLWGS